MADLGIPPWLKPAEPVASFLPARQMAWNAIGQIAEIQQKQQALDEAARHTDMELQMERERTQASMLQHQQSLEIAKAYHDAQIGMRRAELAEAQKMTQMKLTQFAQESAAKQQAAQRIASGEDPAKVYMELGPMFDAPGAAQAAAMRAARPPLQAGLPPIFNDPKTGASFWVDQHTGTTHQVVPHAQVPENKPVMDLERKNLDQENANDLAFILDQRKNKPDGWEEAIVEARQRIDSRIQDFIRTYGQQPNAAPPEDVPDVVPNRLTIQRDPTTGRLVVPGAKPATPAAPAAAAVIPRSVSGPSAFKGGLDLIDRGVRAVAPEGSLANVSNLPKAVLRGLRYLMRDKGGRSPKELLDELVGSPEDWDDEEVKQAAIVSQSLQRNDWPD